MVVVVHVRRNEQRDDEQKKKKKKSERVQVIGDGRTRHWGPDAEPPLLVLVLVLLLLLLFLQLSQVQYAVSMPIQQPTYFRFHGCGRDCLVLFSRLSREWKWQALMCVLEGRCI